MCGNPSPDPVARFLTQKRHFAGGRPTRRAFLPWRNKQTGEYELSVFCVHGLEEGDIWALGKRHVVPEQSDRPLFGRADVDSSDIPKAGPALSLAIDNQPERHANVVGWPHAKDEQKAIATELLTDA